MSERPLVAFTLLAQAAVGAFLRLGALELAAALGAAPVPRPLADAVLVGIVVAIAAALGTSLLHLGSPGAAWRAPANLRTSWLSREVLLALAFALAAAGFAALRFAGWGTAALRPTLAALAALCGIALVYAMARVYRVRTIPAWDTPRTTVTFFAAALLLGSLGVGAALVALPDVPGTSVDAPLRWVGFAATAGFAAELAVARAGAFRRTRRTLLAAGLALALAAASGLGPAAPLTAGALGLALAAEVLTRYLFYVEGPRKPL